MIELNCETCQDTGEVEITVHYAPGHYKYSGQSKQEYEPCQECCDHDEHDHAICLGCGKDCLDSLIAKVDFSD